MSTHQLASKIKLDLITGFLGSGKTTFTKIYVKHLLKKEKVAIIVNDFGAINVDMMMLKDLRSSSCEIEMVTATDEDCYKRRLKSKLISLKLQGFNHVIIEPSGIFDINMFLDILHEDTIEEWYTLNSVIGIIDPTIDYNDASMNHLFIDEICNAGILIFSKVQLVDEDYLNQNIQIIKHLFNEYDLLLDDYPIILKDWLTLSDSDYHLIDQAGYHNHSIIKENTNKYQNLFFFNLSYTKYELTLKLKKLMNNQKIHRIKGFMTLQEGYLVSINVTPFQETIEHIDDGQEVLIVIGEDLDEKYIKSVLS